MAQIKRNSTALRADTVPERAHCGIVMPIASMTDYSESHWSDVLDILKEAVIAAGLDAELVSYTEESSLIHTTIVQNLYDNPIVICDVSGKNPNVMFELGLRLAFDKPTIIIKDDKTGYSFDTGSIEHLTYPRDLRFASIVEFKERLSEKIRATLTKSKADPSYSTFLKHFKRVTVAKLEDKEISGQEFVLEELRAMRLQVDRLVRQSNPALRRQPTEHRPSKVKFLIKGLSESALDQIQADLTTIPSVKGFKVELGIGSGPQTMEVEFNEPAPPLVVDYIMNLRNKLMNENQ